MFPRGCRVGLASVPWYGVHDRPRRVHMSALTIGAVARRAGVGVETVRFYERRGLLRRPPRPGTGFRTYPEETVARLRFIRQAQVLGFTLKEIGDLLARERGVNATSVSYAAGSGRILYDPGATDPARLAAAIEKAGYRLAIAP